MPRALIGHCMAPLNRNEVVIAAGYSPDLDDYSDRMDIYDIEKAIWYTKPWSRLQQGTQSFTFLMADLLQDINRVFFI